MKRVEKKGWTVNDSVRARRASFAARAVPRLALLLSLFTFYLSPLNPSPCVAQEIVDRMVAVVNGRELITHTDLLWQLALQPGVPLDNPRSEDLQRALETIINQRLFAQEAEKLPTVAPTDAEIERGIKELIANFPSQAEFYARLARVGLGEDSEQLREIVRRRVQIENYVDFRFRSFTVVAPQEEADYYRDVFAPRFRRRFPGRIVPSLEDARAEINRELTSARIESDIDAFLEDARARADVNVLAAP